MAGSLVKRYRDFRDNLRGFTDINAGEFRDNILPLASKRKEWSPEDDTYVRALVARGAGPALQRLFGSRHAPAKKILGETELPIASIPKSELESHLRFLIKDCLRAGWTFNNFVTFQAYLDSTMSPTELEERLKRQDKEQAGEPEAEKLCPTPATASADHFAEMYRGSNPAFKQVVQDHLAKAALSVKAD